MNGSSRPIDDLSPEEKRALLARLRQNKARTTRSFPLSFAQQRLWFLDQLMPGSNTYNVPLALRLNGRLQFASLQRSLSEIVRRHATLRTTFEMGAGQPMQVIQPAHELPLPLIDLDALGAADPQAEAMRLVMEEARRPFDLAHGPLLRAMLLRTAPQEHILLLNVHHIVFDGWSVAILLRELTALYEAFAAGKPAPLAELPIQYVDFTVWQQRQFQGELLESRLAYWRAQLHDLQPLDFPTDFPRPPVQGSQGASEQIMLPPEAHAALLALSQQNGTTLFMTLLAAFQVLLARYSRQVDIAVATPIANRSHHQTEGLIGFFVNTLVLRANLSGNPPFRDLLRQVGAMCLDAYAHQDLPFEQLVAALHPDRHLSHQPLVQTSFSLQSESGAPLRLDGLSSELLDVASETVKYDLSLAVTEQAAGLGMMIVYRTDLFEPATIRRMLGHWQMLLAGIVADPQQRIGDLPLLTRAERRLMLERQAPHSAPGDTACLHQLFEAQVRRTPGAIAVTFEQQQLTYADLNQRANQLAHHLRGIGVGPGMLVGLFLERSSEMIVGLLAILKAGAAYLPIDPVYPADRIAFMLADAQISVLVTQEHLRSQVGGNLPHVICLDTAGQGSDAASENLDCAVSPDMLAYVIYTSGSTGSPKGALISHANATRLFTVTEQWFGFGEQDVWTLFHSIAFDFSVWEIWGALLYGGRLVIVPQIVSRSPESFAALLRTEGVTVLNQTPSAFRQLTDAVLGSGPTGLALRYVIFGGEALELQILRPWFNHSAQERPQFINMYGITETTVHVTYRPISDADVRGFSGSVIGVPIQDLQVYILDGYQQPVPIGVPGELYVGGAGVARGYLHRPELTSQRFLPDPFSRQSGARLYRSGDLVRMLPDGDLEYLGRLDQQVKIRGFRIELGEIETALAAHPAIREAVVVARADQTGDKQLVAYLVLHPAAAPSANDLRGFLQEKLPAYMVPAHFVVLDTLPLSSNGKIDRRALPDPAGRALLSVPYSAPQTELEQTIAQIWQEVLRVESVGRETNFFDLGGHSILMAQVHTRLGELFGARVTLLDLFRYPTVSALAAHLSAEADAVQQSGDQQVYVGQTDRQQGSDIAIIGLAGRFAGTRTVREFWQQLCAGSELITFFDDQELVADGVEPALLHDPRYVKAAGYMPDIDLFDAAFFAMSPGEAARTDPQQRLFLECVWHALENAGYDPAAYAGRIGVYAGASTNTYGARSAASGGQDDDMLVVIGNDRDHLAPRISYKLNLRGPSLNVQTACSTSLVAVHLACRSLLAGECEMALAGGVSIQGLQKGGYFYQEGGILSPDGHCRTFDAEAQGTVGGSGLGVVVLKRLDTALADGDYIYAVIKSSAINNDGAAKAGYTAPSIDGQATVIAAALAAGGIAPETIGYIEAHGTGTPLGDPIEIAALTQVFDTPAGAACAIGSVKTNIGHLDAAAGVAGLIKTALSLEQGLLPPSLHFTRPNPQIDFAAGPFRVNTALTEWPRGSTPRRAGVSSFGIGGTNAHVVLEEAPQAAGERPGRPWQLLVLAARSQTALEQQTDQLAAYLRETPGADIADVAYTLQVGRRTFAHRRICICSSGEDAARALETRDSTRIAGSTVVEQGSRSIAFMFPGQGAQYIGMAAGLYQSEPAFRAEVDGCVALLTPLLGCDLRELLYPSDRRPTTDDRRPTIDASVNGGQSSVVGGQELGQTQYTQPALFVIEYALARLLMAWGLRPAALIGHSIGEYVAACLAGVLSLQDALRLVVRRGQLMQQLPSGTMLAVPLAEHELRPLLDGDLDLAAVNGPSHCVVAGTAAAIERLAARLAQRGVETQRLHTSHAFHSAMMEPAVAAFTDEVRQVTLNPPRIPYLSNLSGTWIEAAEATDPEYWGRHLRGTVRFGEGVANLLKPGWILLEVGPGHSLGTLVRRRPDSSADQAILATLRHPRDQRSDVACLQEAVGRLWLAGAKIDWPALYANEQRRRTPLPAYPFERQRYWIEARPLAAAAQPAAPPDKRLDLDDWFSAPFWKQTVPPAWNPSSVERAGCWLIFSDTCGVGERVAARLCGAGYPVITVAAGERFARAGEHQYTLDPRQRPMYDLLIDELRARDLLPSSILHCWSITAGGTTSAPLDRCNEIQDLGYYSLIFLMQAITDQAGDLSIAVVSNDMHRITGAERASPEKATLLGACRVIGQEYPHITCRSIDIGVPEPGSWLAEELSDRLISEVIHPTPDLAVAYRDGRRWIQALETVRVEDQGRPSRLREGGVYLITGGLGAVGLALAEYLARSVRARLVLTGRSAFPAPEQWSGWLATHDEQDRVSRVIRQLQAFEELGAEVLVCQADVADLDQMRQVVEQTHARYGAIHGVIHTAGLPGGGVIALQTTENLARIMAPKVQGTLVLASLFKDAGLDFLFLCSSIHALTGGFGAVEYSAGNTFLDAFAQSDAARSRTYTVSVNWDGWRGAGMSAEGLRRRAEQTGSDDEGLTPAEGQEVFRRILSSSLPQVVVATRDLDAMIAQEQAYTAAYHGEAVAGAPAQIAHSRPQLQSAYVAPETELERIIASIWQELFGIAQIGIHDNFYELGGDSIISLQAAAKARRFHLRLTPKQMLEHQTIAQLALVVERDQRPHAEQELVTGAVPLTAIQNWFFEQDLADRHHWNQALIFSVRQTLEPALLERAFQHLLAQHDALRMRFIKAGGGWQQHSTAETGLTLITRDLSAYPPAEAAAAIRIAATELQSSLDLAAGPLVRAALFNCGAGVHARLLIIIHHLLVDAVSWRVLIEDLEAAYQQLQRGEAVLLPPKTTSFKHWAEQLTVYAQSGELQRELDYWLAARPLSVAPLPVDEPGGHNTIASTQSIHVVLDPAETHALVQEAPAAAQVQPQELLLTALTLALTEWTGGRELRVDLEGHGREDIFADVDLSRTTGWFTTLFPVYLDLGAGREPGEALQAIKTQIRAIPNHGFGYGLLRYLHQDPDVRAQLAALPQPEVSFLYLGQADQQTSLGAALLEPAREDIGPAQSPRGRRPYLLEISAWIADGQLHCEWRYSTQMHQPGTIEYIAQHFVQTLRSLIQHCRSQTPAGYNVADFPYANLNQEDLDELIAQLGDF